MKLASGLQLISNELGDMSVCSAHLNYPCDGKYPHPNQHVGEKIDEFRKLLLDRDLDVITENTIPRWD